MISKDSPGITGIQRPGGETNNQKDAVDRLLT